MPAGFHHEKESCFSRPKHVYDFHLSAIAEFVHCQVLFFEANQSKRRRLRTRALRHVGNARPRAPAHVLSSNRPPSVGGVHPPEKLPAWESFIDFTHVIHRERERVNNLVEMQETHAEMEGSTCLRLRFPWAGQWGDAVDTQKPKSHPRNAGAQNVVGVLTCHVSQRTSERRRCTFPNMMEGILQK